MKKQEVQSFEEFAQEVQQTMAEELKVEATKFTSQEKTDYLKRKTKDSTQSSSNSSPAEMIPTTPPTPPPSPTQKEPPKFDFRKSWSEKSLNEELEIMVKQVKGVLLDTDVDIIRKDLEQTNSVDATITNIVEGRIPEVSPETPASDAATESDATISPSSLKFADDQFGKTTKDRQKSLAERKMALMASAKRHYEAQQGETD